MPKFLFSISIIGLVLFACQSKKETAEQHGQHTPGNQTEADTLKKSLPKETHAMIGDAHITIIYTAPVVKGRVIWGGLVPFNEVWATGAHRATSFEIDKAFSINDQTIPAGKYAIFTIPGEETWTFILNRNWDQHLADDYTASADVLRLAITPERLDENQERLSYSILTRSDHDGVLYISWEKVQLAVPITIRAN
jgi:hypothetical protein